MSTITIKRRLQEHGLRRLRRRSVMITRESVEERLAWHARVLRCQDYFLRRWVYTDGCSFDLARTVEEIEQSERRTLGPMVYRMHEATESLYKDCTGLSLYSKAQGECDRAWGLLIDGHLHISILEKGTVMNRWECAWLLEHRFKNWLHTFPLHTLPIAHPVHAPLPCTPCPAPLPLSLHTLRFFVSDRALTDRRGARVAEGRAGGPQGNPLTPGGPAGTYLCTYVSHQGTRTPRTRSDRKTSPENLGARKSEFRRRVEASCPSSLLNLFWSPRKARNQLQLEPCCDQVDASPVPSRAVGVATVACDDFSMFVVAIQKDPRVILYCKK